MKLEEIPSWVFHLLFGTGFGMTLHAVASELYYKGGYSEILSPQGEYFGLFLMMFSWLLVSFKHFKCRVKNIGGDK